MRLIVIVFVFRLSESNLQAISGAVEEKFMHHSRNGK